VHILDMHIIKLMSHIFLSLSSRTLSGTIGMISRLNDINIWVTFLLHPGNPYRRGRISTLDLLVLTSLDHLLFKLRLFFVQINLWKWGQPYLAFPFSEGSLDVHGHYKNGRSEMQSVRAWNPYWKGRISTVDLPALTNLDLLLLIMQSFFTLLQNKLHVWGGHL
jgi:hypothetical protein